jgi:hypothetical protein
MKSICYYFSAALIILSISSCSQKGCKDRNALNYNAAAEEDDGTCIYCNTNTEEISSKTLNVVDTYFGSQFYNMTVATVVMHHYKNFKSSALCEDEDCFMDYTITNLTNKTMHISYNLYLNNEFYFNENNSIAISPYGTYTKAHLDLSGNICYPIASTNPYFYLTTSIYYQ